VAVAAGAPDGVIQVVDDPSDAVWRALIEDERTGLVLGRGESARDDTGDVDAGSVDSASRGPVLVDASADLAAAAQTLVTSKAFDNSLVGTSESVLIVLEAVADELLAAMRRAGAYLLSPQQCDLVRQNVFPGNSFDPCLLGQDAATIAATAGIEVPPGTRVLLAPFELAVPEEPLASAPPGPLLGVVRVPDLARGFRAASAVLRLRRSAAPNQSGGCAVIHSTQPQTVLAYAAALRATRVVVNQGGSLIGPVLEPERLVTWTTIGPTSDLGLPATGFDDLGPGTPPLGPVPGYPWASNLEAREGRESTL
jgi:acyl-CoA reductase-like NAD-dependent aldehyde dehydrogenase